MAHDTALDADAKGSAPVVADGAGGAQSRTLRRALKLLRAVAAKDEEGGSRLTDLARVSGLHPATAHRLLAALHEEGMVSFDPDTKLYSLGMEILLLGESARNLSLRALVHPVLEVLAATLEDDVYLVIPAGYDGILIDKVEGTSAYRLVSPKIGSRRPIGVGAATAALLAAYPPERGRQIFEINEPRYRNVKWTSPQDIWNEVLLTRKRGYTVVKGHIVAEATAVGVAACREDGTPVAGIGVAATNSRMMPERRAEIAASICREITAIGFRCPPHQ